MSDRTPQGRYKIFSGAILERKDGRILCQKRDRNPKIAFPGYWTCIPGGHVMRGETPRRAVRREIFEEFRLKIGGLRFCEKMTEPQGEARGIYYFFMGKVTVDKNGLQCHEGEKAGFFEPARILKLRLHPVSRKFFKRYVLKV